MKLSRRDLVVYGLIALLALVGLWWQNGEGDSTEVVATDAVTAEIDTGSITLRGDTISDLPTIALAELPPEAIDTLELIETDGPYPFDRDGLTFQNREGLLPDRERGHYEEFTVITPGLDHRGARRIVAGDDGERYYTDDHYDSFSEVTP